MTGADRWTVLLAASAIRDLDEIPPRVVPAIVEFLYGPLPDAPTVVGKPLRGELHGTYSARRGTYRVLYEMNNRTRVIRVFRIATRSDAHRGRQRHPVSTRSAS